MEKIHEERLDRRAYRGVGGELKISASRRGFLRLSRVLPTSQVFTSGYVNTETILHFFSINLHSITNVAT